MMKNLLPRLALWMVLVTILHSCRNDYIPEQNTGHNVSDASKFRIVTLKDIPKVEEYLHKKTGRPDFSIALSKSAANKGYSLPSGIDSSFIVEKKAGAVTYYVFGMKNTGNGRFYNFEIKETNGRFERAEIIEYSPAGGFSGDPMADLRSFSGTVAAYDTDGVKTAEQTYANGYTPCPSDDTGIGGDGGSGGGTGSGGSGGGDGNGGGGSSGGGGIGNGGGLYGGGGGGGSGPGSTGPSGGSCGEYQLSHHLFSGGMLIGAVYINGCGQTKIYHMSEGMNRLTPRCNDGSGVEVWDDPKDPCAKLKAQTSTSIFKMNIEALEKKTGDGFESGYRIGIESNGTLKEQLLQNKPGTKEVELKVFSNTLTVMHSHYDGLYPIFSPGDIIFFNQWVNWAISWNSIPANTPKIPLNNLTFTVVTSNGNYSFNFDGTSTTPFPNYTVQELNQLNNSYTKALNDAITVGNVSGNINYNMEKMEKEFLKFVGKEMNMPGLKLYRTENTGNTELKIENGSFKTTKCP